MSPRPINLVVACEPIQERGMDQISHARQLPIARPRDQGAFQDARHAPARAADPLRLDASSADRTKRYQQRRRKPTRLEKWVKEGSSRAAEKEHRLSTAPTIRPATFRGRTHRNDPHTNGQRTSSPTNCAAEGARFLGSYVVAIKRTAWSKGCKMSFLRHR